MPVVTILSGSNEGNRKQHLENAMILAEKAIGILIKASAVYETEPWGFEAGLAFYNQVFTLGTILSPREVLNHLLEIEHNMGRERPADRRYSSRTIDLDILFYDNVVLHEEGLTIPHPRIAERRFVLVPLAVIMGGYVHPVARKTISKLLETTTDQGAVRKLQ